MKGATFVGKADRPKINGFNPRAREGRDYKKHGFFKGYIFVSIHAPVKGATDYLLGQGVPWLVSIHAPVKGATYC